jgi:hypothetical protein
MKEWFKRHGLLTAEERLLVAGILMIALVGILARSGWMASWWK